MDGPIASCMKGRLICAGFQSCWCDLFCCGCLCVVSGRASKARFRSLKKKIVLAS